MRAASKYRLMYLIVAVIGYVVGSYIMPETLSNVTFSSEFLLSGAILQHPDWLRLFAATAIFFIVLPALYWQWPIKKAEQAKWKILIAFSLSSLVARYQYPEQIAQYFEFIMWLRYPIIAVILVIELYLMVTIIKALWQARTLKGDPRINAVKSFKGADNESELSQKQLDKEDKKQELAVVFAHEPASWFYAIPKFTKNHEKAIAQLNLQSANLWHFALILLALTALTWASYAVVAPWSETVAVFIAALIFYSAIALVANYRVSKHFSVYMQDSTLVLNNSWWGFLATDVDNIQSIELINAENTDKEAIQFGSKDVNLEIIFKSDSVPFYFSGLGMIKDKAEKIQLSVTQPEQLKNILDTYNNKSEGKAA